MSRFLGIIGFAISAVQPVWCDAPQPRLEQRERDAASENPAMPSSRSVFIL